MISGMVESGVPHLDTVLGGGIVAGDLLMVVGAPGAGKTTLVCQAAFHAARTGRRVVFVSTLSEPAARLVKHLRTFSFWDESAVGTSIFFESLFPIVQQGLTRLIGALSHAVQERGATLLVLDGYSSLRDLQPGAIELRSFVNDLAVAMSALDCTTLLTSSTLSDMPQFSAPEFTMCDALIELAQVNGGGASNTRTLRPWKLRGAEGLLGLHSIRIGSEGMTVYPRFEALPAPTPLAYEPRRLSFGAPELDAMMLGGLPRGGSTILVGAPGTGKTVLALQFLLTGAQAGDKGLLVSFRETNAQLARKAQSLALDLEAPLAQGDIAFLRYVPVDLDPDEVLALVWDHIVRASATRVVFDSIVELERALPEERQRSVLAAVLEALRARGTTALLIRETSHTVGSDFDFADSPLELLAENVLLLRRVERENRLRSTLSILKMRETAHDHTIREYALARGGFHVLARETSAEVGRE
jgi:circadian clock protein KaiC